MKLTKSHFFLYISPPPSGRILRFPSLRFKAKRKLTYLQTSHKGLRIKYSCYLCECKYQAKKQENKVKLKVDIQPLTVRVITRQEAVLSHGSVRSAVLMISYHMRLSSFGPFQTKNIRVRGLKQCQKLKNNLLYLNHKKICLFPCLGRV